MDPGQTVPELRGILAKALKRCSLTYEQHQLLHGDGIGVLASQVQSRSKRFNIFLGGVVATFAVLTIHGILTSGSYIPWLMLGFAFGWWLVSRHSKYRLVDRAFSSYLAAIDGNQATPGSLGDELRAGFTLQYEEHQAIRSGDAASAASLIIDRCKANTRYAVTHGVGFCVPGFVLFVGSLFSYVPISWGIVMGLMPGSIFTIGILTIVLLDRSTITKVRGLLQKHGCQRLDR